MLLKNTQCVWIGIGFMECTLMAIKKLNKNLECILEEKISEAGTVNVKKYLKFVHKILSRKDKRDMKPHFLIFVKLKQHY